MGRNIGAGVAGLAVAILLIGLIETIGHKLFPVAEAFDDAANLPVGALLFVVAAWTFGTLGGTFAACRIGTAPDYIFAMLVGAFVLVGITVNVMAFPHPGWMVIAGVTGTIAAAWLGMKLGSNTTTTQ